MTTTRPAGRFLERWGLFLTVLAFVTVALLANVAQRLAHTVNGEPALDDPNPFGSMIYTLAGRQPWSMAATVWLLMMVAAVAVPVGLVLVVRARRGGGQLEVDRASAQLAVDRKGIRRYLGEHKVPDLYDGPGPVVGHLMRKGRKRSELVQLSWEDTGLVFGGPRMGKTESQVIDAIAAAPGACIVTSNKADVYRITSALRAQLGHVWKFDPQQLADDDPPEWWWNPLAGVRGLADAERLASIWKEVGKSKDAREDAYFDGKGFTLLAAMVMAGAVGDRSLTDVAAWLKDPTDTEPARLLDGQYDQVAGTINGARNLPDKQRAGVYDTALKAMGWIDNPLIARWVTDPTGDRPQFDPHAFVQSHDTMYLLSKEGAGSAAPLVTALTATILDTAERRAAATPSGRLPVPMLALLDEAANVCRWRDLPDLYSHYGSRSIIPITILQSWAQGEEVWGRIGMEKLWSAANVRVCLGGVPDPQFVARISKLCGSWDAPRPSTSYSSGTTNRSYTMSTQREPIFTEEQIAALPVGRAIVVLSATSPVLVATRSWRHGPYAERINAARTSEALDPSAPQEAVR